MNLLIVTQKVDKNDDLLGFFHGWIEEFAKSYEKVTVICLQKGDYSLPDNVKVLSLGKEDGESQFKYLFNFYKYIWQERKNYENVFVHMNPEYIISSFFFWKLMNKKVSLWYAHGHVDLKLRLAEKFTDIAFSSTEKGFRLPSKKLKIVGQGINISSFDRDKEISLEDRRIKIITVGRISPAKDFKTTIKALKILKSKNFAFQYHVVGAPATKEQEGYLEMIKNQIKEMNLDKDVVFHGAVSADRVPGFLEQSDLFISASKTGSLDKVVLESFLNSVPVVTCNEAFLELLGDYKDDFYFSKNNPKELAQKIADLIIDKNINNKTREIKNRIISIHSLEGLIKKIKKELNNN